MSIEIVALIAVVSAVIGHLTGYRSRHISAQRYRDDAIAQLNDETHEILQRVEKADPGKRVVLVV